MMQPNDARNSPVEPSAVAPPVQRPARRRGRWVAIVLCAFALVATVKVVEAFLPRGEMRDLRQAWAGDAGGLERAQIQFRVGPGLLVMGRAATHFIDEVPDEVRLALSAVRRASVEIYEDVGAPSAEGLAAQDARMARRGWRRVVEVRDETEVVRIYVAEERASRTVLRGAVMVWSDGELVLVGGETKIAPLVTLIESHLTEGNRL